MFYIKSERTASLLRRAKATTIHNPIPQLHVCLLQIIIHNDLVMRTRLLRKRQLVDRLVQALAQTVCTRNHISTKT